MSKKFTSPFIPKSLTMPLIDGVSIAATNCGIRYKTRDDLLFITFPEKTTVAGVFTTTTMKAAPVVWCESIIKGGMARGLVVNAGNANAFTGAAGDLIVHETVKAAARILQVPDDQIFVASTGVIGEALDHKLITNALPLLYKNRSPDNFEKAARAIMTTDLFPKMMSKTITIAGRNININGIAKGCGMIAPNMATMLSFIFTDLAIDSIILQKILTEVNEISFNSITVDSDTSTNDTALIFATGSARNNELSADDIEIFKSALSEIMIELAQLIVKDGEGAVKLIEVRVKGATSKMSAKKIAFSIANSPLIKTAIGGEDANWGRIVMAVGKSGEQSDPMKLKIKIGDFLVTENGAVSKKYSEESLSLYMKQEKILLDIDIGLCDSENQATVWTCDMGEEYIKINRNYRS